MLSFAPLREGRDSASQNRGVFSGQMQNPPASRKARIFPLCKRGRLKKLHYNMLHYNMLSWLPFIRGDVPSLPRDRGVLFQKIPRSPLYPFATTLRVNFRGRNAHCYSRLSPSFPRRRESSGANENLLQKSVLFLQKIFHSVIFFGMAGSRVVARDDNTGDEIATLLAVARNDNTMK